MNKYRAWWVKEKEMHNVTILDFKHELVHLLAADTVPLKEVILMQSTGLKDKNGVEIFASDVCEWHIPDMGRVEPDAMIRYVSSVEYKNGSFKLSGYLLPNVRLINVLGNIHQNPELLK